jgi:hypothetical protein
MDLIDVFILLGSDRNHLLALLFLLITAFGLFVATLYLTRENVRWRFFLGRSLLLMNTLGPKEKPEEGAREQLESIDFPELQEEMRRGRNANGSSYE